MLILAVNILKAACVFMLKAPDHSLQNFFVSIFEAQYGRNTIKPDGTFTRLGLVIDRINTFFTIYFTVELLINIIANWFRKFVNSGW